MKRGILSGVLGCAGARVGRTVTRHGPLIAATKPHDLVFHKTVANMSADGRKLRFCRIIPITLIITKARVTANRHAVSAHLCFRNRLVSTTAGGPIVGIIHRNRNGSLGGRDAPVTFRGVGRIVSSVTASTAVFSIGGG